MADNIRKVANYAYTRSPIDLRRIVGPFYYKYMSKRADWSHQNPTNRGETQTAIDHVLVIVIDALRPDHVPNLPVDFSTAIAPAPWTFPSVTSIHTGEYPHEHGGTAQVRESSDYMVMPTQIETEHTIAHEFEVSGFNTYLGASFINPFLAARGWYQKNKLYGDADAERVVDDYMGWRGKQSKSFSYLHFGDLHAPISPPDEYLKKYNVDTSLEYYNDWYRGYDGSTEALNWRDNRFQLYAAALNYLEEILQPLISSISDNTLIVITGDHGEAFYEHWEEDKNFTVAPHAPGAGHGGTPWDMVARVPFGIHHPTKQATYEGGWISLKDIPRTLLHGAGLQTDSFNGRSVFQDIPSDRHVICEGSRYGTERKAVYYQDSKIIHSEEDSVTLSLKVKSGSGEEITDQNHHEEELKSHLPNSDKVGQIEETNAMLQDQLEALGYK
ncbi:sulfatase-like hydrolase/transferase [Haloferax sp. ATB1]|uniref:sulfatase-like hydrolase/transferase n=1 Tax=Haloferax sp. ATB1 TaxID=1508454 RepID=UPI0009E44886|nr:sulfatase-like hydrolase/transferase [Haloferax sp. ATB1]